MNYLAAELRGNLLDYKVIDTLLTFDILKLEADLAFVI
jgi:hypothetical protein